MRIRIPIALVLFAHVGAAVALGATGNVVMAGYQLPITISATPGQVLTIVVQGVNPPPTRINAPPGPWPTTLGGISGVLNAATSTGIRALSVPLQSVFPFSNCQAANDSGCGTLTGITLEIPFEMLGASPSLRLSVPIPIASLTISDQIGHSISADVTPLSDQVHILRSLEPLIGGNGGGVPLVTHSDGSLVSASSPAKPGEVLQMYAVGLGATSPSVTTGLPSPLSPLAIAQEPYRLNYVFSGNASPSVGIPEQGDARPPVPAPLFVGLTPGLVGLYQVNFTVIGPPSGAPACNSVVASNLTVTIVGEASFDGAGICVDVSGN